VTVAQLQWAPGRGGSGAGLPVDDSRDAGLSLVKSPAVGSGMKVLSKIKACQDRLSAMEPELKFKCRLLVHVTVTVNMMVQLLTRRV
jgi:hypothetical protein